MENLLWVLIILFAPLVALKLFFKGRQSLKPN